MKLIKLILTVFLSSSTFLGDYIVFKTKFSDSIVFRALADSTVHASIGFLSSLVFFSHETSLTNYAMMFNIIFCTFISSFIDVDHMFVARSVYLKDLTNLKQRGIFHCTTFWLLITAILLTYSHVYKKLNVYILTWMLILAYTSHHIRDAHRRGLWLYPWGHTPAFSTLVYVGLVTILPHVFGIACKHYKPNILKHTTVEYSMLV